MSGVNPRSDTGPIAGPSAARAGEPEQGRNPDVEKILQVKNLKTYFFLDDGVVKALDGVDFDLERGRTRCLVGESGCGKSVTAQSIMRIVPTPPGKIVDGEILFRKDGGAAVDIAKMKQNEPAVRAIRGKEISMIFQEPMTSLSPVHTVGQQISEVLMLHRGLDKVEAREAGIEMLAKVRIPRPEKVIDCYPHQLSGGMRQRAMIARALACRPRILIADEPTTALDVTVQAQILKLLRELQEEFGMALMLITHDLGVVAQVADSVSVFYLGKVMEDGTVFQIFDNPLHPYTKALFASIPRLEADRRLQPITGSVPNPFAEVRGCPFRDRCASRFSRCETDEVPAMYDAGDGHKVRCFLYDDRSAAHNENREHDGSRS